MTTSDCNRRIEPSRARCRALGCSKDITDRVAHHAVSIAVQAVQAAVAQAKKEDAPTPDDAAVVDDEAEERVGESVY